MTREHAARGAAAGRTPVGGPGAVPSRRRARWLALLAALAVLLAVAAAAGARGWPTGPERAARAAARPVPPPPPPVRSAPALSPEQIADLPEAAYDRVISGLIPVTSAAVQRVRVGSLAAAAPLYRTDGARPVARMQAMGPFGDQNPIVVIATAGEWDLVLTPARQALPSASPGGWAPAQSAGWMPARYIRGLAEASARITVHTGARTVVVSTRDAADREFRVAVGAAKTPTPVGVTGYLAARFVNSGGGTRATRIQLTSLHTAAADDPAGGVSGGLVALHWWPESSGAVSHGCVRLSTDALAAVDALPLGTPIVTAE